MEVLTGKSSRDDLHRNVFNRRENKRAHCECTVPCSIIIAEANAMSISGSYYWSSGDRPYLRKIRSGETIFPRGLYSECSAVRLCAAEFKCIVHAWRRRFVCHRWPHIHIYCLSQFRIARIVPSIVCLATTMTQAYPIVHVSSHVIRTRSAKRWRQTASPGKWADSYWLRLERPDNPQS